MEIGQVYKLILDSNILRTLIYIGPSYVVMANVNQDNAQTQEFTVDFAVDFAEQVNTFPTKFELVEAVDVKDQVNAEMAPRYA